ncbi:hypothetical protein WME94_53845 [Sorangium sp. So ce429]
MKITVNVPDDVFITPKAPEQIEADLRQAVAKLWRERGEITAERAAEIAGDAVEKTPDFKEFLRSMPDVGEDADFERPLDYGRPVVEWDT